ncbi:hypothetical protein LINPERPRIM_LOCUS23851 [Linum perenne]
MSFLFSGKLPPFASSAYLALVPKKVNATGIKDYHSISCCNVGYKVISKERATCAWCEFHDFYTRMQGFWFC